MESSKIKSLVIVLLLVVNLVLAALFVRSVINERSLKSEAFSDLKGVLSNNGVELRLDTLPSADGVYTLVAERSLKTEAAAATALINECIEEDQGGNIYYYHSSTGAARFRSSGDFEFSFNTPAEIGTVEKLLRRYDVPLSGVQQGTVSALQSVDGRQVFNCLVSMVCESGSVTALEGRWLLGETSPDYSRAAMGAATALVRFIAVLDEGGFICTEISDMSLGYLMSAQVTGRFELTPVWLVITDTGAYHINAVTGAVERVD